MVTATNNAGSSASNLFSVTIVSAPSIAYTGGFGIINSPLTLTPSLLSSNGSTVTGCALTSGTAPSGLIINASTCVISGTPTTLGSGPYTVTVTNSVGSTVSSPFSITISPAPPTISYSNATGTVGTGFTLVPSVLNLNGASSITNCSVSYGSLPTYLSINPTNCMISGMPTAALATTTYAVMVSTSGGSTQSANFTITIAALITPVNNLVAVSFDHVCSLNSGSAYCWGNNLYGQLGNNSTTNSSTPVAVYGGYVFSQIVAGSDFTCGLTSGATVYCWGYGSAGSLGNGSLSNRTTPGLVTGISGVSQIAASGTTVCAQASSNLYCWGGNNYGQIGDGTTTQRNTPTPVLGVGGSGYLTPITSFSVGAVSVCAASSGNLYCWGSNNYGGLGNGSTLSSSTPVQVWGLGGSGYLTGFQKFFVGNSNGFEIDAAGTLWGWGIDYYGQLGNSSYTGTYIDYPAPTSILGSVIQGSSGCDNSCALTSSGQVYCWGFNGDGEVGNSSTSEINSPALVSGLPPATNVSVAAGSNTYGLVCAITTTHNLYCWGENDSGQVGNNSISTDITSPTEVLGVSGSGLLTVQ